MDPGAAVEQCVAIVDPGGHDAAGCAFWQQTVANVACCAHVLGLATAHA